MLDLLFPRICFGCDDLLTRGEHGVCKPCSRALFEISSPKCPRCALPRDRAAGVDALCGGCLSRNPAFETSHACFLYDGPVREAVRRAKAREDEALLLSLTDAMSAWFEVVASTYPDASWIAVPAHDDDIRRRGWDPPRRLLERLAERSSFHLCIRRGLIKVRATSKQADLDIAARWRNLRGVFEPADRLEGTVVVFDDVMTTGATLHHAARAAREGGADEVVAVVAARTPR